MVVLIAREDHSVAVLGVCHLEQPVDRLRLAGRSLAHALGRASRRCGEGALEAHSVEYPEQSAYDRGLAGAGTAGEYHHAVIDRPDDRLPLQRGVFYAEIHLGRQDYPFDRRAVVLVVDPDAV